MQITYDTKADAMYIKFCDGEFMANKEVGEGIILDIGKDNALLGIEILEASSRFRPEDLARVGIQKMPLTASDFQEALYQEFQSAQSKRQPYVDIQAGALHRRLGGYPGHNNRMPVCCGVMVHNMRAGDTTLVEPEDRGGKTFLVSVMGDKIRPGPRLTIRYKLPR